MLADVLNLNTIQQKGLPGFTGGQTIGDFINNSKILDYIFGAAGIALLIYLIMGGFQLMLSRGDPKAMQAAQSKITYAVVGFVIVAIAFLLTGLLGQLLGVSVFTNVFGGANSGIRSQ
jgi:hypothetical protein